ncbi:hypothetical protein [Streptomyces sp. IB2014 016-6]|uniref:hypothetical protein n=1 Tax=Streptomyces sp. IB2014 016-6 TaxID=2517818 RepID=UPI0011C7AFF6|nr:hypothetical protein [Streptomyces sp. IB2014 016-6]TXL87282.1 hypothetical protein EW053_23730 [Streptomyces sp. IB2014 016-6]
MGIESDQLVYDYLSRVGDVAQQRQLPSGDRMRLVSELRGEIDKQRGKFGGDSPAAVRRILGRLGSPDQVVGAAASGGTFADRQPAPDPSPDPVPEPRSGPKLPKQRGKLGRGLGLGLGASREGRGPDRPSLPKQKRRTAPETPAEPTASPPHLAPMHELGESGGEPDWWRVDAGPMGTATGVSGFVGGVEIPEILKPPPTPEERAEKARLAAEAEAAADGAGAMEVAQTPERRRLLSRLRPRAKKPAPAAPGAGPGLRLTNPFLLLAAALLVVGAVLGSWLALAGGWVLAYASRRLSRFEAKLAVFGLPIVAVVGGGIWLWGRTTERWGEPIPEGTMGEAISATWPLVIRVAAVSSALFLVWRSRRR